MTANFGKEFARTGILDPKFHRVLPFSPWRAFHQVLIQAQDRRNIGDYAIGTHLTKDEVKEMLAWAMEFQQITKGEQVPKISPKTGVRACHRTLFSGLTKPFRDLLT